MAKNPPPLIFLNDGNDASAKIASLGAPFWAYPGWGINKPPGPADGVSLPENVKTAKLIQL
jgi:hypothetical protein